jgi:predicted ester cyclase
VTTGAPPCGKHVTMTGCNIAHWRGTKVIEEWEHGDYLGVLQQIGVIPPLGGGKK